MILKVSVLIAGACIFIIIGAVIAGIPVLSILYATDLKPLTIEFYLLMVGSGFLAFAAVVVFFAAPLVVSSNLKPILPSFPSSR